jgi:tetratricopeptide (TPR) repeat protein
MNGVVSPATNAIVQRCLCADPALRYPSAAELRTDLDLQLRSLPLLHAREPSIRERAGKWVRRHPRMTSATSVTMVAAALVLALVSMLLARSEELATIDARNQFADFEDDFRTAQIMALDAAVDGADKSADVVMRGEQALGRFGIASDANWRQARAVRRLSRTDQERLSRDIDELRFLVAAVRGEPRPSELLAAPHSLRDECVVACWYSVERRFREALPHWQAAVDADPQNVWTWYGLACCYDQLGQETQAIAGYTACIAIKPHFAEWYFRRGVAYLKQHYYQLADADFSKALASQPDRKELLIDRALARIGLADYAAAIADLKAALKTDGNDARAYFMLAQAQEKSGDAASADASRQCGLQCVPTDDAGWVSQGVARLHENCAAALVSFDRALECNPHCLPAMESKAHVLAEKLGRADDAIAILNRAVQIYPEQATLHAARGVLLGRLKSQDAGRRDAECALALDSSDAIRYQVAGIYALLSEDSPADRSRAIQLLASVLKQGYGSDLVVTDSDLDSLRADPEFQRLIAAAQTLTSSTNLTTAE